MRIYNLQAVDKLGLDKLLLIMCQICKCFINKHGYDGQLQSPIFISHAWPLKFITWLCRFLHLSCQNTETAIMTDFLCHKVQTYRSINMDDIQ